MSNRSSIQTVGFILLLLVLGGAAYLIYSNFSSDQQPNRTTEAIQNLNTGPQAPTVANSPLSPVSPVMPARAPERAGDPAAAKPPLDPEELFGKIEQAEQAYNQNDYDRALQIINEVISLDAHNPFAFNTRGNILVAQQRLDEALSDFNRGIALDSSLSPLFYNRGRLYATLENHEAAIADLEKSVQLNAKDFGYRAKGNIGSIYHQLGEFDQALDAYNESITFDGTKADVYYLRGETHLGLDNYEAAIADFQAALERFGRYDTAYQSLGYAYFKMGQYEAAQDAFDQALEISPDDSNTLWYKVLTYLAEDELTQAQNLAKRAVAASPSTPHPDKSGNIPRLLDELEILAQQNSSQSELISSIIELLTKQ